MSLPITSEEFAEAMRGFSISRKMAVAVSGGGDSMALAALLQEWAAARGIALQALTVDHQIRKDSSKEAAQVRQWLEERGFAHQVLAWEGEKPCTHIQEIAREARYALLLEACREQGIATLAVAHNQEDQVETFWMRLAHGSGLDGLASMASVREAEGVQVIRPVLGFPRERLRATCQARHMPWVEDPSNTNAKYLRVKLRAFEDVLQEEGLTPARLGKTIQKLEEARKALQEVAVQMQETCAEYDPAGYAALHLAAWKTCPAEIQRRVLAMVLQRICPQTYALGFDKLEQTRQAVLSAGFAGKTVGGCEIVPAKNQQVYIVREESKAAPVPVRDGGLWDKRFRLSGLTDESLHVAPLGEDGLAQLRKNEGETGDFVNLPFKIKRVFPAVWQDQTLLAVPHLGYYNSSCRKRLADLRMVFIQ